MDTGEILMEDRIILGLERSGDICRVSSIPKGIHPLIRVHMEFVDLQRWKILLSAFWFLKKEKNSFLLIVQPPLSLKDEVLEAIEKWDMGDCVLVSHGGDLVENLDTDEVISMVKSIDGIVLERKNTIVGYELSALREELRSLFEE